MTLNEVSDIFDTRLNTFGPGYSRDEYEKSLYLTYAQDVYYDEIIKNFEVTNIISEKIDRLLNTTSVVTFVPEPFGGVIASFDQYVRKVLREKVVFDTNAETPAIYQGQSMQVREERLSEIESSLENPFRTPGEHFVLRAAEHSVSFNKVSLYTPPSTTIKTYIVTLAVEPTPIVLEDLPNGLTVRDTATATAALSFKDKDMYKIIEIAIALVLKDAGAFESKEGQGRDAIGKQDKAAPITMLSELESLLKTYKISPKREHSDHIDNAPGKILSAIDSVSAGLKRRDKLETRPEFNVPEKILSAVDAISAETQRKPKRETVKDQNLASKVLSAVDSIAASTERKAKTSTDRAPGKDVEQTLDQLGKVLAGGKKQTRN